MSEVYGGTSKVLIDVDKGNPAFFLPLEQLLKNAPHTADTGADAGGVRAAPSRNGNDNDPARSRDRSR